MRLSYRTLIMLLAQVPSLVLAVGCARFMAPGYWPDFDHDLTSVSLLVGILAAGAAAWRATAADATFFTASTTPLRAAVHHFGPPVLTAWTGLALSTAILLTGPLGEDPGGSSTWTIALAAIVWSTFSAILGAAIGIALRGRGLLATLLAVLLTVACIVVSRVHAHLVTLTPVVFTWADGSTVNGRPDPRFLWTGIGAAVILAAVIIIVTVSRSRWRQTTAVVATTVIGASVLAAILSPAGPSLQPRSTNVALVCTPESRSARICGWPEEEITIRGLSPHWDEVTAAAETLGAPIPHGTTYSEGLGGLAGDHGQFTLRSLMGPGDVTSEIIADAIQVRSGSEFENGVETLFYPENVGITVQEVLFPDAPDNQWTKESDLVRKWVEQVRADAIAQLREPTERYLHREEPHPPWENAR